MTNAPTLREAQEPFRLWLHHIEATGSRRLVDGETPPLSGVPDMGELRALVAALSEVPEDDVKLVERLRARAMTLRRGTLSANAIGLAFLAMEEAADRIEALSQPRELEVSRVPTGPAMGDSAGMRPKG